MDPLGPVLDPSKALFDPFFEILDHPDGVREATGRPPSRSYIINSYLLANFATGLGCKPS
jgi:hypothetical protein